MAKPSMTKEEFYEGFIKLQKKTGQGTTGLVKVMGGPEISKYLDEFIEEGLCVVMDTGGSLGHPESNRFYMPSKGYNVFKEENTLIALLFVRYYLGIFEKEDRVTGIKPEDFSKGGRFYKEYKEWLDRNEKELEVMVNLSEVYPGK